MGASKSSVEINGDLNLAREIAMSFAGIGMYRFTFDGTIVQMDEGALRLFEIEKRFRNPADVVGKNIADLVVYKGTPGMLRKEIRRRKRIRNREWEFTTLRGHDKWALEDSFLVRDPETGEESIQVVIQDITERKHAEEALAHAARVSERLRALMVSLNACERVDEVLGPLLETAVDVCRMDGGAIFLAEGNEAVLRYYHGVDEALVREVGRRSLELPLAQAVIHSSDPVAIGSLSKKYRDLLASFGFHHVYAAPLRTGGSLFGVLVLASRRKQAPDASSVHTLGVLALEMASVFHRLRTEQALRYREEQYRSTLDSMADSIHVTGTDLNIRLINRAFVALLEELGLDTNVVGRPVLEAFPFLPPSVLDEYRHVMASGEIAVTEERNVINGREIVTETRKIPIVENGSVRAILTVMHDMTKRDRAAQALRESEEKYRTLVEVFPHSLAIFQDQTVVFVNEATRAMFGYARREDLIGRDTLAVVADRDRARLADYARRRAQGDATVPNRYEAHIQRANGEEFPVEVFLMPVMFQGRPAIQALSIDITERQRAERAILEGGRKYRNILENIQEGYYEVDLDGHFTFVNPALCRIMGYPEEELMGLDYHAYYDPAVIERVFHIYNTVYMTGNPVQLHDWEVVRKDGTKAVLGVSVTLMRDAEGQRVGFSGIARDVTQRIRTEQALRESEERYRELFENAYDIVYTHDLEGWFTSLNKAGEEISGYTREEMTRTRLEDIVPPEMQSMVQAMIRRKLGGEVPTRYELEIVSKDGRRIPIEVSTRLIVKDGAPVGIQGIARDITERKRAEEERKRLEAQIQHAQKLEGLGVLAGGIAHDFNNLLVGMLGYAGLALAKLPEESPARAYLEKIESSAQRAADLTNQMLAYSGKGSFVVRPLNLSKLVTDVGHLLAASISKKAILRYQCEEALPSMVGDTSQLHQVVMNLITNASDALGDDAGMITIATRTIQADRPYLADTYLNDDLPPGLYVCLEVSDTGCGMDAETQSRIFDPFFSTKFAGRGLGLAAVLGIVRGHKGAIKVYSEPGHGTTFRVLFPASTEFEAVPAVHPAPKSGSPPDTWRGSGTILVADDEEAARSVARESLERNGFTVVTANDGQQAVEAFRARLGEIRLVLLDLTMPVMNGQEAFEAIHAIDPNTPVVLSSGYTQQDVQSRFSGPLPAGFIQKPYLFTELIKKVHNILGDT